MLTKEQRAARLKGIGGSDVAAIMGMSPWKTANEVYLEKRGEITEENIDDKEIIIFGNLLEDVVAGEYSRRNGVKVERRNAMYQHREHEFMLANIDRKIVGVRKGLECKTTDKWARGNWGEAGTSEVPDYYHLQSAHYMEVLGYDEWDLAVLIGGNEYRDYHLERDPELGEMITEACVKFWERVTEGIPPDIDFAHSSTEGMIKRLYPGTNGKTITLPSDLEAWHKVKVDADKEVSKYKSVSDACKARIMAAMEDNAIGVIPGVDFQYKRSAQKRKEHVVKASEFIMMRGSKWTAPKVTE
jgi:putative phage-type endonuclease